MTATDDAISLREYMDREITSVRREIATLANGIQETAKVHADAHTREHNMTNTALTKAEDAMTIRLEQMNEFRQQITTERGTFSTKPEVYEIAKRLEEMITRNDARLTKVETFVISANAQMGTLRALMAVVMLALAIAGFVFQQSR